MLGERKASKLKRPRYLTCRRFQTGRPLASTVGRPAICVHLVCRIPEANQHEGGSTILTSLRR